MVRNNRRLQLNIQAHLKCTYRRHKQIYSYETSQGLGEGLSRQLSRKIWEALSFKKLKQTLLSEIFAFRKISVFFANSEIWSRENVSTPKYFTKNSQKSLIMFKMWTHNLIFNKCEKISRETYRTWSTGTINFSKMQKACKSRNFLNRRKIDLIQEWRKFQVFLTL